MDKKEALVACTHRNAVKCRLRCSHRAPHPKQPTDDEDGCTDEGYCTTVSEQVQCEEIKVCLQEATG